MEYFAEMKSFGYERARGVDICRYYIKRNVQEMHVAILKFVDRKTAVLIYEQ